jgi:hypothetical protein
VNLEIRRLVNQEEGMKHTESHMHEAVTRLLSLTISSPRLLEVSLAALERLVVQHRLHIAVTVSGLIRS